MFILSISQLLVYKIVTVSHVSDPTGVPLVWVFRKSASYRDAGAAVKWKTPPPSALVPRLLTPSAVLVPARCRGELRLCYVCDEVVVTAIEVLGEFSGADPDETRRDSM